MSFGRQFDFMTSSTTYSIVTLTIDALTTFLQLLDVPNIHKNARFSPNKSWGKTVKDGGIFIDYKGFVHIFNPFVC